MAYTPEQQQWAQSYIGSMGSDAGRQGSQKLWDSFGGDQNQFNQAINHFGVGGAGYDPNAISNAYRANQGISATNYQGQNNLGVPPLAQTGSTMSASVGGPQASASNNWGGTSTPNYQAGPPNVNSLGGSGTAGYGAGGAGTGGIGYPQAPQISTGGPRQDTGYRIDPMETLGWDGSFPGYDNQHPINRGNMPGNQFRMPRLNNLYNRRQNFRGGYNGGGYQGGGGYGSNPQPNNYMPNYDFNRYGYGR